MWADRLDVRQPRKERDVIQSAPPRSNPPPQPLAHGTFCDLLPHHLAVARHEAMVLFMHPASSTTTSEPSFPYAAIGKLKQMSASRDSTLGYLFMILLLPLPPP